MGKRVSDALREAPLSNRQPDGHRSRGSGECRTLAQSQGQTRGNQRHEAARGPREYGRDADNGAASRQNQTRSELIADPTAEELEYCVGDGKGREDQSQLRIAEMEIELDQRRSGANVHTIHK